MIKEQIITTEGININVKLPVITQEAGTEEDLVVYTGDHDNNHHHSISNTNEIEDTEEKTNVFNSVLIIAEKLPSDLIDTAFVSRVNNTTE